MPWNVINAAIFYPYSQSLKSGKISGLSYIAVKCLSWQELCFTDRAEEVIGKAVESGTFQFLHQSVLQSTAFKDESAELRELIVQKLNQLLMDFLDTEIQGLAFQ